MTVFTTSHVAKFADESPVFEECTADYMCRLMYSALRCTRVMQFRKLHLDFFKMALFNDNCC
jgi:hypothetical protein